jgi:hypothetical protein
MKHLLLTLLLFTTLTAVAQSLPSAEGERQRYGIQIDFGKASVSGVCMMLMEDGMIKGSIVNEFGVSFLDFTYSPAADRVQLVSVIAMLDKWYIRKTLRKDLRGLMHSLQKGETAYQSKRGTYRLCPHRELKM